MILDEVQPVPVQVPYVKPDPEKANPKIGVGQVAFSRDNRYLATKNGMYSVANVRKMFFVANQKVCNSIKRVDFSNPLIHTLKNRRK